MSKISELSDGGVIQGGDTLIAVRSGGNVKVTYGGSTTANIDGGTIDGTVIGGTTPAAVTTSALVATTADINAGTIDGTVIGGTTAAAGTFTTGQFNTSLNVTGTVTATTLNTAFLDGNTNIILTVDADNDQTGKSFLIRDGSGKSLFKAEQGGDISFYEDTGTTAKLFWDASAESLGIGTSSPANPLTVSGSAGTIASFSNGVDADLLLKAQSGVTTLTPSTGILAFGTSSTERMRIDSSGNLLVGKSGTAFGTAGVELRPTGGIWSTVTGGGSDFNRLGTDGAIQTFWKDGTTVGSIGVVSSDIEIHSSVAGHVGLRFANGGVFPTDNTGTVTNGLADIGNGSFRFKDLYLSGGVYLGGTGAANHLDDYEEGTWTGTLTGSSTAPSTAQTATGTYTKVGNLVTVNIEFSNKDVTGASGNAQITGLPFTCGDNVQGAGWNSRVGSSTDVKMAYISSDNNIVWLNGHGTSLAWTTVGTGTYTAVTITFMVA